MDCIDRQAAVDLFPDDTLEWDTYCGYIAPHFARKMISGLPSVQPVPHWTPCSEHTPDSPIRVMAQLENEWKITAWYDEGSWYSVPPQYDEDGCWLSLDESGHTVLAWMLLPESYHE